MLGEKTDRYTNVNIGLHLQSSKNHIIKYLPGKGLFLWAHQLSPSHFLSVSDVTRWSNCREPHVCLALRVEISRAVKPKCTSLPELKVHGPGRSKAYTVIEQILGSTPGVGLQGFVDNMHVSRVIQTFD